VAVCETSYVTGDAAFSVDRHGIIVSWNHAAEKMFGIPSSKAIGQTCWKILDGQDIYGNRYCWENCPLIGMVLRHESVHSFRAQFKTACNGMKNITISCLQVYGGAGDRQLLHICNASEETENHVEKTHPLPRQSTNGHRGELTSREIEVLALLAEGKTTREIAKTLCIGIATARNHIQHTLYKLHVHTRLEAVVLGQRLDLV